MAGPLHDGSTAAWVTTGADTAAAKVHTMTTEAQKFTIQQPPFPRKCLTYIITLKTVTALCSTGLLTLPTDTQGDGSGTEPPARAHAQPGGDSNRLCWTLNPLLQTFALC